jgi:hypothetical protein
MTVCARARYKDKKTLREISKREYDISEVTKVLVMRINLLLFEILTVGTRDLGYDSLHVQ